MDAMSTRVANAKFLVRALGGRIDALPGYYLTMLHNATTVERADLARRKRAERARDRRKASTTS